MVLKEFGHHFRPSEDALRALWQTGTFSFDANVLLNLYGYSKQTRTALRDLIERCSSRTVIPAQFGLEYSRGRARTICRQIKRIDEAIADLKRFRDRWLVPAKEHPHLSSAAMGKFECIKVELEGGRKDIESMLSNDPFAEMILTTFADRVGAVPNQSELDEYYKIARERYDRKVPPGYEDEKDKNVPDCFADYIGWQQLMDLAKKFGRDFIFVTDDSKPDWWHKEESRPIGPRPELRSEFKAVTGQSLWMYNSASFLRASTKFMDFEIAQDVIDEVENTLEERAALAEKEVAKPSRKSNKVKGPTVFIEDDKPSSDDAKADAFQIKEDD